MKHLLSIFLFTLACSCQSIIVDPDWGKLSLNGNVKSVKETSFSVTTSFGDYVKSDYNKVAINSGFPCESRNIIFNEHGKITKVTNSYGNDIVQIPIYDSSHNLIGEYMTVNEKLLYFRQ